MSEMKPVGLTMAALVAAIPVPGSVLDDADQAMAQRQAEADALAAGAAAFEAAEPFAPKPARQGDLFDL
jgi:hypothetical protein